MMNDFHYAHFLLNEFYGIDISTTRFEELGLIAHNLIGNKTLKTCVRDIHMKKDLTVQLPCELDLIESVTIPLEDWNYVTNTDFMGDRDSLYIEQRNEAMKHFKHFLYEPGKFVKYELIGNILYFKEYYPIVRVLYRKEVLDDDELPLITNAEAIAIAAYVAWITKLKEAWQTMDGNLLKLAQTALLEWLIRCDQARSPESVSQNELDQVLDAKSSWNRKVHGKSFKPLR